MDGMMDDPENWEALCERTARKTGQKFTEEQKRALRGTEGPKKPAPSNGRPKFNNNRVQYDGKTFDSEKERDRYMVLKDMEARGVICDLQHHRKFKLRGELGKDLGQSYVADFSYGLISDPFNDMEPIVEDVKPTFRDQKSEKRYKRLPHYRLSSLKQAILCAMGYDVREV